jgi:hypothetical protein
MGGWEGVEYADEREDEYAEEDEGLCPANEEFRAWLRDHFRLEAAEDPNDIVDAAEAELWDRFAEWIGPLYPDVVNARTTEE